MITLSEKSKCDMIASMTDRAGWTVGDIKFELKCDDWAFRRALAETTTSQSFLGIDWAAPTQTTTMKITIPTKEDNDMDIKLTINGSRDTVTTDYVTIKIGCEERSVDYWLREDVLISPMYKAIGRNNNYTSAEIKEYGGYIKAIKQIADAEEARVPKVVVVTDPEEGHVYNTETHVPENGVDVMLREHRAIEGYRIDGKGWFMCTELTPLCFKETNAPKHWSKVLATCSSTPR